MTEIAFHFNVPDRLAYACRLLRKALGRGVKLVVTGPPQTLQELDAELWTFSATDFVPHCFLSSDPVMVEASPVVLTPSLSGLPHQQVLLNLGPLVPDGFKHFERVIEIVGLGPQERQDARSRWKHYVEQGYPITRHDLNLKSAP